MYQRRATARRPDLRPAQVFPKVAAILPVGGHPALVFGDRPETGSRYAHVAAAQLGAAAAALRHAEVRGIVWSSFVFDMVFYGLYGLLWHLIWYLIW